MSSVERELLPPEPAADADEPEASSGHVALRQASGGSPAGIGYRITFGVLLIVSIMLLVLGNWRSVDTIETPWRSWLLLGAGLSLLLVARRVERRRLSLPGPVLFGAALLCAVAVHLFAGIGTQMDYPVAAVLSWLLGIGLVVAASWQAVTMAANAETGIAWSRLEMVLLGVLFVAALAVRLPLLASLPAPTGDEASMGETAADVIAGRLRNPFVVGWFSFPSLFYTIPALSITLFGQNYIALRVPAVVAGALTVVGLYWCARPLFGRAVAGIAAVLLATLHYHMHFSRLGLNNIWDGLFAVVALGLFWRGWQTGHRLLFCAAGLVVGLSQYFYTGSRLIPLIVVAWLGLLTLVERQRVRERLSGLLIMALAAVVIYLPLGLFFVQQPGDFFAPTSRVSLLHDRGQGTLFEQTSQATGKPIIQLLVENYRDAVLGFTTIPLLSWYNSRQPMLLPLSAGLFMVGLVAMALQPRDQRYWLLLLWLAGVVSIGALTESTPAAQRYVIGAPVAVLVVAIGLTTAAQWAIQGALVQPRLIKGIVAALVATAVVGNIYFYYFVFGPENGKGDRGLQLAGQLGHYIADYPAGSLVYYFHAPGTAYGAQRGPSFLAPQVTGQDVEQPLVEPPDWPLGPRTAFVFVPERESEFGLVQQRYPGGSERWFYDHKGQPLFLLYEIAN